MLCCWVSKGTVAFQSITASFPINWMDRWLLCIDARLLIIFILFLYFLNDLYVLCLRVPNYQNALGLRTPTSMLLTPRSIHSLPPTLLYWVRPTLSSSPLISLSLSAPCNPWLTLACNYSKLVLLFMHSVGWPSPMPFHLWLLLILLSRYNEPWHHSASSSRHTSAWLTRTRQDHHCWEQSTPQAGWDGISQLHLPCDGWDHFTDWKVRTELSVAFTVQL